MLNIVMTFSKSAVKFYSASILGTGINLELVFD